MPPTTILPSAWITNEHTLAATPVTGTMRVESNEPSELTRPRRRQDWPLSLMNAPPTTILPSAWTAAHVASDPSVPAENERSKLPLGYNLPRQLQANPERELNPPQTTILPSGCKARQ